MDVTQALRVSLRNETKDHWRNGFIEEYIQNLLPKELAYARDHGGQTEMPPCDTLVLMLGFSPEPLLQTICLYKPRRIVLICNHEYVFGDGDDERRTGGEWAEDFRRFLYLLRGQESLLQATPLPQFDDEEWRADIAIANHEATPYWIFRELCERVLRQQGETAQRIVVDITGAKKSMVTGAYLFADYSGATISYVDFEEYDPEFRRPYGFTCRIGAQPNPSEVLSLRDWTRVRNLYTGFFFGAAAREAHDILRKMESGITVGGENITYFTREECDAVARMLRCFKLLEFWDNGDHTAAWKLWTVDSDEPALRELLPVPERFTLPEAVQVLGSNRWPTTNVSDAQKLYDDHIALKHGEQRASIFTHLDWLIVYAHDEILKIRRLIDANEDYRSAFLRAASLDELLLKARLVVLWERQELQCKKGQADKCFAALTGASSAKRMRDVLSGKESEISGKYKVTFWIPPSVTAPQHLAEYWQPELIPGFTPELMSDLRNESIHTYLPIPRDIADAAYVIAERSIGDFTGAWVSRIYGSMTDPQFWRSDWDALCQACGLTFLPSIPKEAPA